jgi:hypothetical protein
MLMVTGVTAVMLALKPVMLLTSMYYTFIYAVLFILEVCVSLLSPLFPRT